MPDFNPSCVNPTDISALKWYDATESCSANLFSQILNQTSNGDNMPQTNPAAFLDIRRVLTLPAVEDRTPSTMYVVRGDEADLAEVYFTGNDASEIRSILDKSAVQSMINSSVTDFTNILVTADITSRAALASTLTRNVMVLVLDASGDATVDAGSAMYMYEHANTTFHKVSEFESLDVTLTWDSIEGRPTSTPAQIDAAVAATHTHANKALLDGFGTDVAGRLTLGGVVVGNNPVVVAAW